MHQCSFIPQSSWEGYEVHKQCEQVVMDIEDIDDEGANNAKM